MPVLNAWRAEEARELPRYESGTWGPEAADKLVGREGRRWRRL